VIAVVTEDRLDVAGHEAAAAHVRAGATVSFSGVVREHDHGRGVIRLEYHAHPSAGDVVATVVAEFAALPDVLGIAVSHRVGTLEIGDIALVAAVSTAHRREAFEICARLVDEVKHRLPVWKRQVFADGTDEWVNCP
jgi:molybdopterin synthase catalytic subunit